MMETMPVESLFYSTSECPIVGQYAWADLWIYRVKHIKSLHNAVELEDKNESMINHVRSFSTINVM